MPAASIGAWHPACERRTEQTSPRALAGGVREHPGMGAGWVCRVLSEVGPITVEQLDSAGRDWFAEGPGGEHLGTLAEALASAVGESADRDWLALVIATTERDCTWERRSMLLVKKATGTLFHSTFSDNRASISRHGLDWTRTTGRGIAGSSAPETDGIFLCADLEGAEWFAEMGARRGWAVDIWAVRLDGTWLIGDPGAGGGGDEWWMICPEPIPRQQLTLLRKDLSLHDL